MFKYYHTVACLVCWISNSQWLAWFRHSRLDFTMSFSHQKYRSNLYLQIDPIMEFFFNKHCMKSVRIQSFSGSYFPTFELNTERCSVIPLKQTISISDVNRPSCKLWLLSLVLTFICILSYICIYDIFVYIYLY